EAPHPALREALRPLAAARNGSHPGGELLGNVAHRNLEFRMGPAIRRKAGNSEGQSLGNPQVVALPLRSAQVGISVKVSGDEQVLVDVGQGMQPLRLGPAAVGIFALAEENKGCPGCCLRVDALQRGPDLGEVVTSLVTPLSLGETGDVE